MERPPLFDKPFYHLVFVHPLKVVYCPIPKAACTSWKAYLRREMGLPDETGNAPIHGRALNGLTYANTIEREELIRILFAQTGGYFKFMVCRNPYDRLRAAYRDLVWCEEGGTPRGGKSVEALRMVFCAAFDRRPSAVPVFTFEQFVRAISVSDAATLDRHWQVQATLGCLHLLKYDAVLKFENMAEEAEPLRRRFGGLKEFDMHRNKGSSHKTDLGFSLKMREIVQQVYARDFARFGYDPKRELAQQ